MAHVSENGRKGQIPTQYPSSPFTVPQCNFAQCAIIRTANSANSHGEFAMRIRTACRRRGAAAPRRRRGAAAPPNANVFGTLRASAAGRCTLFRALHAWRGEFAERSRMRASAAAPRRRPPPTRRRSAAAAAAPRRRPPPSTAHCQRRRPQQTAGLVYGSQLAATTHVGTLPHCRALWLGVLEISVAVGTGEDVMANGAGAAGAAPDVRHQPPGYPDVYCITWDNLGYPGLS